jgi:hypothetical protein
LPKTNFSGDPFFRFDKIKRFLSFRFRRLRHFFALEAGQKLVAHR